MVSREVKPRRFIDIEMGKVMKVTEAMIQVRGNSHHQIRDFLGLTFLSGIGIGMLKVSAPLYAKSMGADSASIGLVTGMQPLGMMLMSIPTGLMVASMGSRNLYIIGSLIAALCYVLAPLSAELTGFVVLSAVASLFMPFRFISVQSDFFKHLLTWGHEKAGWLRATQMCGAFVLGPILGGYLIHVTRFTTTYLLIAFSFLMTVLLARRVLEGRTPAPSPLGNVVKASPSVAETLKQLFSHRQLRRLLAVDFVVHMTLIYFATFSVIIAMDDFAYSETEAAGLTGVQGFCFMLALLVGGNLRLPIEGLGFSRLSYGLVFLGLTLLGLARYGSGLWLGAISLGLGLGFMAVLNLTRLTTLTQQLGRGNVAGMSGMAGPGGGLVGSLIGGVLGQVIGLQNVFLVLLGVFMFFSFVTVAKQPTAIDGPVNLKLGWDGQFWLAGLNRAGVALVLPLVILALWILSVRNQWVAPQILPSPEIVLHRLTELASSGELSRHLTVSFWRVVDGVLVGGGIGFVLGIVMGLSRSVESYLNPTFKAFASVPGLAWVPLAILLIGIGEPLKVVLIAVACAVPVASNTLAGIRNVPHGFVEVGRVYRFSYWQMLSKVMLPATLPPVFSGFSLALNQAWQTLIAVELLASSEGVGFLMIWGRQLMQMDLVFSAIIVIGLVGLLLDKGLRLVESRLLHWRPQAA